MTGAAGQNPVKQSPVFARNPGVVVVTGRAHVPGVASEARGGQVASREGLTFCWA